MKHIVIIGGTGSTGRELISHALQRKYKVTAIVRNIDAMASQKYLSVVRGDVKDLGSLKQGIQNADAVISCFGPSNHKKVGNLMSKGTANIVQACEEDVRKLIFMSGFVQSDGHEFSWYNRMAIKLLRTYYHQSYKDKVIAENHIKQSTLNWVIIRAVALHDKGTMGSYSAGKELKVSPFRALSYADCARCLLDAVEINNWNRSILNVGRG